VPAFRRIGTIGRSKRGKPLILDLDRVSWPKGRKS
jgi:hypothetical protein